MSRRSGIHFGRYEALFRIAQGGMAEVFAARISGEAGFERLVAVKRMLAHLADDEHFVNMFLDEARLAAPLASPHVVSTLDLGRDELGSPYIVLELVVGVSLASLMHRAAKAKTPLPLPVALEVLAQTARGLHHAHQAQTAAGEPLHIVHRDVSPQNVMVARTGLVMVSDFGIAKAAIDRLTHTSHGSIKGKIAYLSPEQAHGVDVDRTSDVYAMGIVAWQLLTGKRLRSAKDDAGLLQLVRSPPTPPPVSRYRDGVPEVVIEAVARALERDPKDRWQTAAAFDEALRRGLREVGSNWDGSSSLAEWLAADPPPALTELQRRIRAATEGGTSTEPALVAPSEDQIMEEPTVLDVAQESVDIYSRGTEIRTDGASSKTPAHETPLLTRARPIPPPAAKKRSSRPLIVAASIGLLAALLILGGVWLLSPADEAPPVVHLATEPTPVPTDEVPAPDVATTAPEAVEVAQAGLEQERPEEEEPPPAVEVAPATVAPPPAASRRRRRRSARRRAAQAEPPSPSGRTRRRRGALDLSAFDQSTR